MQATGQQPQRAPGDAPVHYDHHRPEQTTLYRLVQQPAATFFAQAEGAAGADLPQFVKDEFEVFLECGILAHGFLRLRCSDCGHDKRVAFSCKRRGFCPAGGAWRKRRRTRSTTSSRTCRCASGCCRCRSRLRHVITRQLPGQAGVKADEADSVAVTLMQRFGSAANLNIHLHCLVLDGVYRRSADGTPEFVEVPAPTAEAVLHKIITRTTQAAHPSGVLVEVEGSTYLAGNDGDSDAARVLRPLQAAACAYRIAFGPTQSAGLKAEVTGDAAGAFDVPLVKRAVSNLLGNATRVAVAASTVRTEITTEEDQ